MKQEKGYCLHCTTNNTKSRVFMVNPDDAFCYCPNCGAKMEPQKCIKVYNDILASKVNDARFDLLVMRNYEKAYADFGEIIDFDPDCNKARFGRLLSLACLSTLRKTYFQEILLLLREESELYFHAKKGREDYLNFILQCFILLQDYKINIDKKLTFKKHFYEVEGIQLYFKRIVEIIALEEFFIHELKTYFAEETKEIEKVSRHLEMDEETLKKNVATVDGSVYFFVGMNGNRILLGKKDEKEAGITSRFVPMILKEEGPGVTIPDLIFKTGLLQKKIYFSLLPTGITFLVLTALLIIAGLILKYTGVGIEKYFFYSSMATGAVVVISIIICIISQIDLRKRRRHLS